MEDAPPLESYLVQKDHPTENPKILLAYCASGENITPVSTDIISVREFLTLKVLVATIDALGHFETG